MEIEQNYFNCAIRYLINIGFLRVSIIRAALRKASVYGQIIKKINLLQTPGDLALALEEGKDFSILLRVTKHIFALRVKALCAATASQSFNTQNPKHFNFFLKLGNFQEKYF